MKRRSLVVAATLMAGAPSAAVPVFRATGPAGDERYEIPAAVIFGG